jgi:hypothetical protein
MFEGKLKEGDVVLIKVRRPRYPEHNALAHVVMKKLADATGHSPEAIKMWLKCRTGRVDLVRLPDGKLLPHEQPMDFESMPQDEYQQWWDEAVEVIKEEMFEKLPQQTFEEIRDIIAGKYPL